MSVAVVKEKNNNQTNNIKILSIKSHSFPTFVFFPFCCCCCCCSFKVIIAIVSQDWALGPLHDGPMQARLPLQWQFRSLYGSHSLLKLCIQNHSVRHLKNKWKKLTEASEPASQIFNWISEKWPRRVLFVRKNLSISQAKFIQAVKKFSIAPGQPGSPRLSQNLISKPNKEILQIAIK